MKVSSMTMEWNAVSRRLAARAAVYLGIWAALALVFAAHTYLASAVLGEPLAWRRAVTYALAAWSVWAVLAPAVVALAHHLPFALGTATFAAIFHLFASALFSFLHTLLWVSSMFLLMPEVMESTYGGSLRFHLQLGSHINLLTYWCILGVAHATEYYRRSRDRELNAVRLAADLTQARLDALRMELNPHFLFNTLNTISSLVYSRPRAADQMIARLGSLLRATLETRDHVEVPLNEELSHLRAYLAIEQERFGGQLAVAFDVEPSISGALVPSLILQPVVENAIRHGIANNPTGGALSVGARRQNGQLVMAVSDTGGGSGPVRHGMGIGLANTRARLEHMYGRDQALTIDAAPDGVTVLMTIPLRLQAS